MGFDRAAAKAAGYSDQQIDEYLATKNNQVTFEKSATVPPPPSATPPTAAPSAKPIALSELGGPAFPEGDATPQAIENAKHFAQESALPTVGGLVGEGVGILAAPFTAGVSTVAFPAIGAGIGETLNQKFGITEPSKAQIALVAGAPIVMRALGPAMRWALKRLPGAPEALHEAGAQDARALASRVRITGDPSQLYLDAADAGGKIDTRPLLDAIRPLYESEAKLAGKNAPLASYMKRLTTRLESPEGRYMDPLEFHEEMSRAGELARNAAKTAKGPPQGTPKGGWGKYKEIHAAFHRTLDAAEEKIDVWMMNEAQHEAATASGGRTALPSPGGVPEPAAPGISQRSMPSEVQPQIPGGRPAIPGTVEGEVIPPNAPPGAAPSGGPEIGMGRVQVRRPLESARILKQAIAASRREFAEKDLGDYIEAGIDEAVKGSRTLSGRGDVTEVNAKKMIDLLKADTNMKKVFSPQELADIEATLKRLNRLPTINKESSIVRHAKTTAIGAGIGAAVTGGTPVGGAIGGTIGAFAPDLIAKAVTTAPGRAVLNKLIDITAGNITRAELNALAVALAANSDNALNLPASVNPKSTPPPTPPATPAPTGTPAIGLR